MTEGRIVACLGWSLVLVASHAVLAEEAAQGLLPVPDYCGDLRTRSHP